MERTGEVRGCAAHSGNGGWSPSPEKRAANGYHTMQHSITMVKDASRRSTFICWASVAHERAVWLPGHSADVCLPTILFASRSSIPECNEESKWPPMGLLHIRLLSYLQLFPANIHVPPCSGFTLLLPEVLCHSCEKTPAGGGNDVLQPMNGRAPSHWRINKRIRTSRWT